MSSAITPHPRVRHGRGGTGGRLSVSHWRPRASTWRRDVLRTNLWLVPTLELLAAVGLFAITYNIDQAAYDGDITLPAWVNNGGG